MGDFLMPDTPAATARRQKAVTSEESENRQSPMADTGLQFSGVRKIANSSQAIATIQDLV
jgi:glycine cleavage system regulatory protein